MRTPHHSKVKISPPFCDTLALLDDATPRSGAMNMALDEALLAMLTDIPILRCYRWQEREVSFGCFGRSADVANDYPQVPRVRRWTGGGVVEHGPDFTFTLLIPKSLPLGRGSAADSYEGIHSALAAALRIMGFGDLHSAVDDAQRDVASSDEPPFLKPCFSYPVEHDLLAEGRKIAGGAQRRTRRGLMHQGSVQNYAERFVFDEQVRRKLSRHLAAVLANRVMMRALTSDELNHAQVLTAQKYGTVAWTDRI